MKEKALVDMTIVKDEHVTIIRHEAKAKSPRESEQHSSFSKSKGFTNTKTSNFKKEAIYD